MAFLFSKIIVPFFSEHQFCGGKLTKSQGTIKTPNWPENNYPAGISCSWLITVEPEMVRKNITLQYRSFSVNISMLNRWRQARRFLQPVH